jgi:hypothetical protein
VANILWKANRLAMWEWLNAGRLRICGGAEQV